MTVHISLQARRDIDAALSWWRANRPAARELLEQELRNALELLQAIPRAGAPALDPEAEGLRRLYLKATRYFVYYSEKDGIIEVLRVWHASRGDSPVRR